MFEAQYLFSEKPVYSPWFNREADNILATVDVVVLSGVSFRVRLFHKDKEDAGPGVAVNTDNIGPTGTGRSYQEWEGLKELVRYKFALDDSSAAGDRVLFRMLSPVWFDAVEVGEV